MIGVIKKRHVKHRIRVALIESYSFLVHFYCVDRVDLLDYQTRTIVSFTVAPAPSPYVLL